MVVVEHDERQRHVVGAVDLVDEVVEHRIGQVRHAGQEPTVA